MPFGWHLTLCSGTAPWAHRTRDTSSTRTPRRTPCTSDALWAVQPLLCCFARFSSGTLFDLAVLCSPLLSRSEFLYCTQYLGGVSCLCRGCSVRVPAAVTSSLRLIVCAGIGRTVADTTPGLLRSRNLRPLPRTQALRLVPLPGHWPFRTAQVTWVARSLPCVTHDDLPAYTSADIVHPARLVDGALDSVVNPCKVAAH